MPNPPQDEPFDAVKAAKELDDLIAEMNAANKQFKKSTGKLLKELNTEADELLEDSKKMDAELTQVEKDAGDKLDVAMDELISEDDEPDEEDEPQEKPQRGWFSRFFRRK